MSCAVMAARALCSVLPQRYMAIRPSYRSLEECPKGEITNPYGRTKGMLEQILTDLHLRIRMEGNAASLL